MAAAVSQASSAPLGAVLRAERHPQQPRPEQPGGHHAHRAQPGDDGRRRDQGPQPLRALVDEMRDQIALHRGQRHQQRRAGQRHRQDHHAARRAQVARRRLQQHRKAHHQDRAGTGRGDRVRRAAQERRGAAGRQQPRRRARRRRGDQHDQPGHRAGHGRPQVADQPPADHERGRGHRHPDARVGHHQRAVLRPPVRPRPACPAAWRAGRTRPAPRSAAPRSAAATRRTRGPTTAANSPRSPPPRPHRPSPPPASDACAGPTTTSA